MSDATNDSLKVAVKVLEFTDLEISSAMALNNFSVCSSCFSSVIVFMASVNLDVNDIVAGLVKYLVTGVMNIVARASIANAMDGVPYICGSPKQRAEAKNKLRLVDLCSHHGS